MTSNSRKPEIWGHPGSLCVCKESEICVRPDFKHFSRSKQMSSLVVDFCPLPDLRTSCAQRGQEPCATDLNTSAHKSLLRTAWLTAWPRQQARAWLLGQSPGTHEGPGIRAVPGDPVCSEAGVRLCKSFGENLPSPGPTLRFGRMSHPVSDTRGSPRRFGSCEFWPRTLPSARLSPPRQAVPLL